MSAAVRVGDLDPTSRDADLIAHYGDPVAEQRAMERNAALVHRGNRGVIAITGPERLTWLHNLTTQHLLALEPGDGTELLVLSPHGHVEHDALLVDDGSTTWLDVEPGTATGLIDFLLKMRFLTRADPVDVTSDWAVLSIVGPDAGATLERLGVVAPEPPRVEPVPAAKFASRDVAPRPTTVYATVALPGGGWARRHAGRVDLLVPRESIDDVTQQLGVPLAGTWAFDALRVAARRPRLGSETDHRTIPAEIDLLAPAVHLDKGCYRGQETVARVHNLGRPPRRLVLLHLDGVSTDELPAPGTPVMADGREVGFVGTAARHHELGMIALAVVKRNVADDAALTVGPSAAAIDPPLARS
ncbi:MAG TPA: glycine cleavage T C-terminal barrel domain-containing protein [Micromonosporaceae bacterium]|nr:glycine cleavage T C-terminal barrel domain-containing protein [Micromonosporaceae bacterium]